MKLLVVGGGAREHALIWKLKQSPKIDKIYCIPGNPGISELAECMSMDVKDVEGIRNFAMEHKIDLTLVGPENPLELGIVDAFKEKGLKIFGPTKEAAEIETSKIYSKRLMERYHIPTAQAKACEDIETAISYIKQIGLPCVIKADGLASGKGVVILEEENEILPTLEDFLKHQRYGTGNQKILVEEFLVGQEFSVMCFSDGKTVKSMPWVMDHKKIGENNTGLNTGGMGAVTPLPFYNITLDQQVTQTILNPTITALGQEGRPFVGILFAGLMLTEKGIKVLEFNARFGDPETEILMPLLETDLMDIMEACLQQTLGKLDINWSNQACAGVVLASRGYPEAFKTGYRIQDRTEDALKEETLVFHGGTQEIDGNLVTAGGRVLIAVAKVEKLSDALQKAYERVDTIDFQDQYYRSDIGKTLL
jgi:phosphoribosylamine--glycine ligase